jgi:hypothetical protein
MQMIENWKTIPRNQKYECSDTGKIRSKETLKVLKSKPDKKGYHRVSLSGGTKKLEVVFIHRIMGELFVNNPDPKNNLVTFKDSNKDNLHHTNLEWSTSAKNMAKIIASGHFDIHKHAMRANAVSIQKISKPIKLVYEGSGYEMTYPSIAECCKDLGISRYQMEEVIAGKYELVY